MKKVGRNDPCPCGSGKKFKKCCENKMLGGRFMARPISTQGGPSLTSFFHQRVTNVTESIEPKKFEASTTPPPPQPKDKPKEEEKPKESD